MPIVKTEGRERAEEYARQLDAAVQKLPYLPPFRTEAEMLHWIYDTQEELLNELDEVLRWPDSTDKARVIGERLRICNVALGRLEFVRLRGNPCR
jgi:hypothetical protein